MKYKNIWNNNMIEDYKKIDNKLDVYDNWLDRYKNFIMNSTLPIVDLGCGIGNDTLYIKKLNKNVISVDYSEEALNIVKKNINNAVTLQMDFEGEWLLKNKSADLIIANLSLHYFDEKTTFKIINNIKETLVNDGILIVRVNSIDDENYGAKSNDEIEHHYYKFWGINKRFFDKKDIEYFFSNFSIISCIKEVSHTAIHNKPKIVWECVFKNSNKQ